MNSTPIRPGSNEREELARLLLRPVERDLPSDRHRQLQEFVMNYIQQDLRSTARGPRRSPGRLAYLTAALAAGAVVAVAAVAISAGALGDAGTPVISRDNGSTGQQILLAAAATVEKTPDGTGAYWYVKVASTGSRNGESWQEETWTARDGRTWSRSTWRNPAAESANPTAFPERESDSRVIEVSRPNPFVLGGAKMTIEELQALPAEPAALKARISELVDHSGIRTSTGKLTAAQQQYSVFEGLVSLVSLLPAPPKVRAAALRVIASYPNVTSVGAVDGGQGLLISFHPGEPARLVIDPATGRLRRTNVLVLTFGGTMTNDGGTFAVEAEWTDTLPR